MVLVVDDEPALREMLSFELTQEGFEVETAESAMAAVAALRRRKFDVALTDVKMPGMKGTDTLEALHAVDPDIEVIVGAGYASVETALACIERGAYDYITKPYDLVELKHLLERALQKSHLQGMVALYEAGGSLLSTQKRADLVTMAVNTARQVLRAEDLGLLLPKRDGGFEVHGLKADSAYDVGQLHELAERVSRAREPVCLSNADPLLANSPYGSVLVYPLMARGHTVGVLAAFRHLLSPAFAPSELQKGTLFAHQLGLSLDNAQVYESLGEKIDGLVTTREQLVQSEKLALAGQLANSVAHEVNNPLSFIRPNLEVLVDYAHKVGELWSAAQAAAAYLRQQSNPLAQAMGRRLQTLHGDEEQTEALVRDVSQVIDDALVGVQRIGDLVTGFARLAEPPTTAKPQKIDLVKVTQEALTGIDGWVERDGRFLLDGAGPHLALVEPQDVISVVRNLFHFSCVRARGRQGGPRVPPLVQVGSHRGVPYVHFIDESLVLSDEDKRRIFDPRVEVDNCKSRTMRLNLGLASSYQMLLRSKATIVTDFKQVRGLTVRIMLQPVP